ncbi:uncharacterized protein VP01_7694g1 [Puccinia sorghi]|uniref:Tf2-1-like SH3-like domain-containing protein n=1 Tax=Puccinia sorghi TaxID=27349 RepID=A0A0L6UDQ9_9BASI|nr:uncharacterized protein VP01_7694g1 [Puccinia sorghi]
MAEFAYNNATHSLTRQSPFQTLYSRNPIFDSMHVQRYKQQADKLRLQTPFFIIFDSVWLNACNIQTTRPTPKLSERKLGPFKIKSFVSKNTFKLSLPSKWKAIHPVLHVSPSRASQGSIPEKKLSSFRSCQRSRPHGVERKSGLEISPMKI